MPRSPRRRRNPTRVQHIWCVKTTAINIPREYRRYAVPGFGGEPRVIWTRQRKIAQQISNADEQAGGQAYPMPCGVWRCPLCGRWHIGLPAQEQRQRECFAWLRGKPLGPCGPWCNDVRAFIQCNPTFADVLGLGRPNDLGVSDSASGYKMGSHGGKATTDQCDQLDIRFLRRRGYLKPGATFRFGFARPGKPRAMRIQGQTTDSSLIVSCEPDDSADPHHDLKHEIQLLHTPCYFGGERKWLQCPAEGCGRRVAVLYWQEDIFACRHCCRLAYLSQREEHCLLRLRRALAIRKRLGGAPDLTVPFPAKPKRMHWQTYGRLQKRHDHLLELAWCG